jgi:hypothetical protein
MGSVKYVTCALVQRVKKHPMCATGPENQYAMTVRCESVRAVKTRVGKLCEDCFHELVKILFWYKVIGFISHIFCWKYVV